MWLASGNCIIKLCQKHKYARFFSKGQLSKTHVIEFNDGVVSYKNELVQVVSDKLIFSCFICVFPALDVSQTETIPASPPVIGPDFLQQTRFFVCVPERTGELIAGVPTHSSAPTHTAAVFLRRLSIQDDSGTIDASPFLFFA